ncbi:MAG: cation diffusion facilitator family transporter [Bacteroidales bacterium]|nr:cation diffusion facilitator family transporter [Bacteroidales bacterium]
MESHHHHTIPKVSNLNRAFIIGIVINTIYVIIELLAGIYYNSLSLISDAGHNLSDVAALALALLAFRLAKVKANDKFTYGYRKSTILVSLINSVVLFIAIGGIIWESIDRINHPVIMQGLPIAIVAGIGIIINFVSAMLFFKDKGKDLNVKGAYLHMMADAAVSLGVVISGVLISLFHIYWLDMATSLIIVLVIFYSTWNLFKDSLSLTLDGVPKGIDFNDVISEIKEVEGVIDVHHLHIWAISTSQNAITAHVLIHPNTGMEKLNKIKKKIKQELEHVNIQHVTLEFETEDDKCCDTNNFISEK